MARDGIAGAGRDPSPDSRVEDRVRAADGTGSGGARAERTVGRPRSRLRGDDSDTACMTRETAVPTAHPASGGVELVVAGTAVLLALSLLLLL